MQPNPIRRRLQIALLLVLLALIVWTLLNPYRLLGWYKLRGYTPPAEVAALADETSMTDAAKHLFYINHPAIEEKANFRENCPKYDNQTITIGCYLGGQRGIHILSVTDERLNGVEEVTAAHEMLHAAYERLGRAERQRINMLLDEYAANQLQDDRIKAALKGYEVSEPGQQHNEMHSIFGTEIVELPAELEQYYARYFESRQQVARLAARYQDAFQSRQAAIKHYDDQLAALASQIKANTATLQAEGESIEKRRAALDQMRTAGDIEDYNAGVAPFNASIDRYNNLLEETKAIIAQYNHMVEERNAIAAQSVELQEAIDSSALPKSQ